MDPKGFADVAKNRPEEGAEVVSYDAALFFDGMYRHSRPEVLRDRDTIGPFVTELDSRFHFNATENALIRALVHVEPIPQRGGLVRAWEHAVRSRGARLFDLGSGSGHWVQFFLDLGQATEAVACEIAPRALQHLHDIFDANPNVTVTDHNLAVEPLPADLAGDGFDFVTAIGVMFHIVDDSAWRTTIANLAAITKPGGLLLVGGEFGDTTRNVQFHADDAKPMRDVKPADGEPYRVSKRVRSLSDWEAALAATGNLEIVTTIFTEGAAGLVTPENNVLVLRRPARDAGADAAR